MLEKRLREIGQERIADLLRNKAPFLDPERIGNDLDEIDTSLLRRLTAGEHLYTPPAGDVRPAEVIPAKHSFSPESVSSTRLGEDIISSGKVAALVVAGGQGSRLGIDAPKGVVEVTPITHKSLFQLHAEKILALNRRYGVDIPLFVMTSRINNTDTKAFFIKHRFFGLNSDSVHFFTQGLLPSLTPDGSFIISPEGGLFMNPDGHGGTFSALRKTKCLEIMRSVGIEEIFYFQVDNPLVQICDPLFIGLHAAHGAQMSSKVVRKISFEEKVGVIARINGRPSLIEYSDMDDDLRYATDENGEMLYWAGSIAIHMIRRDFVEDITSGGLRLPYHQAQKKIPALNDTGKTEEIEGIKFETFIFDALPLAKKSVTLEVLREEEFAPVKNKTGQDSLESSMSMQISLHRSWLEHAGIGVNPGVVVEISPLFALNREDLEKRKQGIRSPVQRDLYLG